jgi:hypothetical protein
VQLRIVASSDWASLMALDADLGRRRGVAIAADSLSVDAFGQWTYAAAPRTGRWSDPAGTSLLEALDQGGDVLGAVSAVAGEPFGVGVKFPIELQQLVPAVNGGEQDLPYQMWLQVRVDAGHDRADVGDRIGGARVRSMPDRAMPPND